MQVISYERERAVRDLRAELGREEADRVVERVAAAVARAAVAPGYWRELLESDGRDFLDG